MKLYLCRLQYNALLLLVFHAGCISGSNRDAMAPSGELASHQKESQVAYKQMVDRRQQFSKEQQISKEEAVAVANKAEATVKELPRSLNVVACEKRFVWVIMYDGGGTEYFISKKTGEIYGIQKVPQGSQGEGVVAGVWKGNVIDGTEAEMIARKDYLKSLGKDLKSFDAITCELSKVWRVFFEFRAEPGQDLTTLPNSDTYSYFIDKRTGEVLHRQPYN